MSFWANIGIADYDEQENNDSIAKSDTLDILVNLPTGKIESRHNACETCGRVAILGNGLCMKCWDYVVDNSSANSKFWPDASQYLTIKTKKVGE